MKKIIEKIKRNKKKFIIISAAFLVVVVPAAVWALNTWDTGYRINRQNRTIYFKYGNGDGSAAGNFCARAVNDTADKDLFMPTKTYAEMKAFDLYAPTNVSGVGVCCEFSRCKNFDTAFVNSLPPENRVFVQCAERTGCCPVYEDDYSISGEALAGFFDCIRQGPLATNACAAAGWSATCNTKGACNQVGCNTTSCTGSTCDCECRQKTTGADAGLYCADYVAGTTPKMTCRVRTDKTINQNEYKDLNSNGGLDQWDDWLDSVTPNPLW